MLRKLLDKVEKIILKNDNLKTDDLDNHIKIILNRAISDVSSTIQKEFQTSFAEINSINDVLEFEKLSSKAIKKVVDVLRKHKTGIALFAKKYARKFKDSLEILDSYLQEIKNLTSNYNQNQEFLSIINENLEKITTTKNTIADQEKHIHDLCIRLEKELTNFVGAKYGCLLNSASTAIFLCLSLENKTTITIPSIIPPVVINMIVLSGNKINLMEI